MSSRVDDWLEDADGSGVSSGKRDPRDKRRKPRKKRTAADLLLAPGEEPASSEVAFGDPDMQSLYARGYFDTLIGMVKGGKEATVFLVGRGEERYAAKVYADIEARSFQNDGAYWAGVAITDARIAKAMRQRTRAGQAARIGMWVGREYSHLWLLHRAGLPVPKPAVGPEPSQIAEAGSVVLMEFVGEGDAPATRLSEARLSQDDALRASEQSVGILVRLARLGLVHGDFSTYNLLWHGGRVVLIDVPQMVELRSGQAARELLERDVRSLATSFRRLRVELDVGAVRRAVWAAASGSEP